MSRKVKSTKKAKDQNKSRLIKNLEKKGWSKKEIEKVRKSYQKIKQESPRKSMDKIVYWLSLTIMVIASFIVAIVLVPFILVLPPVIIYILVSIFGLGFGLLFSHIIHSLEEIELKHHLFGIIILPLISVINLIMIINVANFIDQQLGIPIHGQPELVAALFVFTFLLPYVWGLIRNEFL